MVDGDLHDSTVHQGFASPCHLAAARQLDYPPVHLFERSAADDLGPAKQGRVVGGLLQVQAAELAPDQAVSDELFGLLIAPALEPLDDEHAENPFDWCGGTTADYRMRRTAEQASEHRLKQAIVVEQLI
jgi:hypothetical protein